jgi:hypothetical protein
MTVKGGNWSGRKSFQPASLVLVARAAEYCLMSKANLWFEMGEFARYITGSSTVKFSAWDNPKKQALGKHLCVNVALFH